MKSLQEMREVKKRVENELLARPGVTGVDIGYKVVGGQKTNELSIRVLVEKKKRVPKAEAIPTEIDGIKTDVIERRIVPTPALVKVEELKPMVDTGTYDPLRGGISIGPCRSIFLEPPDVPAPGNYVFVGTLGCIVRDRSTNDPMLLSNFHVMGVTDTWGVGDTQAQPSRPDGGSCPGDVVGSLQRTALGGKVDCAVASHTARGIACDVEEIGKVAGQSTATMNMPVRKRGRTTGLTHGTVDSVDLTVSVPYGDGIGTVTFTGQIGIEVDAAQSTMWGTNGDSGSVVVDSSRRVVGLYFAGSEDGTYGVANPIQDVLDALDVDLCVSVKAKPEIKELLKERKLEWKEFKLEKNELKEFFAERKPIKEIFEKGWVEGKEFREDPGMPFDPRFPDVPGTPGFSGGDLESRLAQLENAVAQMMSMRSGAHGAARSPIEERIARLEAALGQMSHFINPGDRPDLTRGALTGEPDVGMAGRAYKPGEGR